MTMLFFSRKFSPFTYSLLPECSYFTSKLSAVKSSNAPEIEANEDRRKQMTVFLINECGFSESQVLAIGRRREELFKTRSIRRAQQAVQLFRDWGFTEDQVRKIISSCPSSLQLKVDTQLKPKIEFMKALGFSGSNIGQIVTRAPRLLTSSLEQNLSPKIDLFKQSSMQEILLYLISTSPSLILGSYMGLKLKIEYVKNLGVLKGSKTFANALKVVDSSGIGIFENKLKHLATLGLLENEILQIVTKFPTAFGNGIDKMTKNMDFLTNTAGFQPNIVVSYPALLNYSIEKRFQPRHEVIEFLRKTDPTRLPKNVATVYNISGSRFAEKFGKYKGKFVVDPAPS